MNILVGPSYGNFFYLMMVRITEKKRTREEEEEGNKDLDKLHETSGSVEHGN